GLVLISIVPCVKSGEIAATRVPRPVCRGLVPPLVSEGPEPRLWVCRNCVANCACDALKPTVWELAKLLPATSTCVSAACMPVRAVVSADARPITKPQYRKWLAGKFSRTEEPKGQKSYRFLGSWFLPYLVIHSSLHFAHVFQINQLIANFVFVRALRFVFFVHFHGHTGDLPRNILVVGREGRDLLADQAAGGGQALLCLDGLQRRGELIRGGDRAELPNLLHELRVIHRVQRVLVLQLADNHIQEFVKYKIF